MSNPLFSFGVIADIQYADRDDAMNYTKTRWRYYRKALKCLKDAIDHLNDKENTSFVLQLGDLIDGYCRRSGNRDSNFRQLTDAMQNYPKPIAHCWGNHELYNFTRKELMSSVLYPETYAQDKVSAGTDLLQFYTSKSLKDDEICCYHFTPHTGFRFIVIDCYDVSALGRDYNHPKTASARETLDKMNPSDDKNDHRFAVNPKYVKYNGALSDEQLKWLSEVLNSADAHKERVVVCGHIPIDPKVSLSENCVLWNNSKVLNLCKEHDCVVAYFAGHEHNSLYYCDENGIHQYSFPSVLEAVPEKLGGNETAFATIDVFIDRMEVRGIGDVKTSTLMFR